MIKNRINNLDHALDLAQENFDLNLSLKERQLFFIQKYLLQELEQVQLVVINDPSPHRCELIHKVIRYLLNTFIPSEKATVIQMKETTQEENNGGVND